MTIDEVMNLGDEEIRRLSRAELGGIVEKLSRTVNARYSALGRAVNVEKAAYRWMKESGGTIRSAGLTRNQLLKELYRGRRFLTYKTSSVAGARRAQERKERAVFGGKTGKELGYSPKETEKIVGDFYEFFEEFKSMIQEYHVSVQSPEQTAAMIWDETGGDMEVAKARARAWLGVKYEEEMQNRADIMNAEFEEIDDELADDLDDLWGL